MAIGVGLLSTFKVSTGHAMWIGYQAICTLLGAFLSEIVQYSLSIMGMASKFPDLFFLSQAAKLAGHHSAEIVDYHYSDFA